MKAMESCALASLLALSLAASADTVVVVHPSNGNALDQAAIARIFLGKAKSFPDGAQVVPINQKEGAPAREAFNTQYVQKNGNQLKAYWSQLVFTGKGTPPKEVDNDDEVKKLIAANPNMIGYVDAAKVDASVKVVGK
ncbi:MAG: phosphate ABC transporter substrate-binding protein [Gammaproteobacteria bacterium]|nr:phosphate ABC transporter substrate-binding protein [Gammaproteobacteria bacterium]